MISASGGTLIVAIPCRDGLVISADKTETNEAQCTSRNDAVKIHKLSPCIAFGIAGYPLFYRTNPLTRQVETIYDLRKDVEEFYSSRDTKLISQTWDELGSYLQNRFYDFLSTFYFEKPLPIPPSYGDWLYQLPFWYLTANGELGSTTVKMRYKERAVQYFICETPQEKFQRAEAFAYGHKAVLHELKIGSDSRFDEYRNDQKIMRFLKNSPPAKDTKTSEALDACERLIIITSKWIPHRVGFSTDSILIHKQKGVRVSNFISVALTYERTQERKKIRKRRL